MVLVKFNFSKDLLFSKMLSSSFARFSRVQEDAKFKSFDNSSN